MKQHKQQLIYEVNWVYGNFLCNKFIAHCELNIPKIIQPTHWRKTKPKVKTTESFFIF